jgi:galactan 5-O-arabinofuranosyltransferase
VALAAVLATAAMLDLVQTVPGQYGWARDAAMSDYYPSGRNARGESDPKSLGAWTGNVIDAISDLTDGTAPDRLVVLTAHYDVLAYQPYHGFQSALEQYANPLAHFEDRRDAIESWAASTSQDELLDQLDRCPYPTPTVFVLRLNGWRLQATVTKDTFPTLAYDPHTVTFDERLFDGPAFRRRNIGPFAVIVRTDALNTRPLSARPLNARPLSARPLSAM